MSAPARWCRKPAPFPGETQNTRRGAGVCSSVRGGPGPPVEAAPASRGGGRWLRGWCGWWRDGGLELGQ